MNKSGPISKTIRYIHGFQSDDKFIDSDTDLFESAHVENKQDYDDYINSDSGQMESLKILKRRETTPYKRQANSKHFDK